MTKKLFHTDSYKKKFQAKVINVQQKNDLIELILNQTCFYPEAGGQICDKGNISGFPVVDVQELDGNIIHYLKGDARFNPGMSVNGEIEWETRFDHMQQHTGQHILSSVLKELWQKETLSFHMGVEICTIDIPFTSLEEKKIEELECFCNKIIYSNKPIYQYYIDENKSDIYEELRKKQQKLNEKLRIVEIAEYDINACGGTHCRNTGEVAIIKISNWERRKDKTRISFLCGHRGFLDYQNKHYIVKNLSNLFTTGISNLEEKVIKLSKEKKELDKENRSLEKRILQFEVEILKNKANTGENGYLIINKTFSGKTVQQLKNLALAIINEDNYLVILGAERPEPVLCLGCSQNISIHMGNLLKKLLDNGKGKGGGSEYLAMAKLKNNEELPLINKTIVKYISEMIVNNEWNK